MMQAPAFVDIRPVAIRAILACLLLCLIASASFAGTVSGTITNGTNGKPASGVQVILIQLQGTMQPVANATTDAQGHYQITNSALGTAPMLMRAVYQGVNYHQPVLVGTTTVDMQVFEPTDKTSAFSVSEHAIILQPTGSDLEVGEQFSVQNSTQPPVAYYRSGGSFLFTLPAGAQNTEISANTTNGMPVIQTPIDKGKGIQAIDFPFRPGETQIRITYHMPYPNNEITLHNTSQYPADAVAFAAPPTMKVSADGFAVAGQESGFNIYLRKSVPANAQLTASVSGTAPPPSNTDSSTTADNSQNPSVNSHVDSASDATPTANITTMPARLDSLKWIVVGGFAAIFALGAVFIMRKGHLTPAGAGDAELPAAPEPRASAVAQPTAVPQSVSDLEKSVSSGLDELKDALFRLELRHQAGTISADDYSRERQRIDEKLRDLVRG
jgi:hypothetical protein